MSDKLTGSRTMLNPQRDYDIPEETQRIAQAAFPKGNPYMRLRDAMGSVYEDEVFAPLFSPTGQPALAAWRLAWVTVLQFAEGLTDRQAADAVRARIDWKYVLGLPSDDPGFDYSVLSEFRGRLLAHESEYMLLEQLLERAKAQGWLKAGRRQRTDSTYILAAIQRLNRIELVGQTMQHALNEIARCEPEWLKEHTPFEWWDRYAKKLDDYRLPKTETARRQLAEMIGRDGLQLLRMVNQADAPPELASLEAIRILEHVWQQQYLYDDPDDPSPRWRDRKTLPPAAERIASPHDPEARYSTKRGIEWHGYKVHLTETCEPDAPHLIVSVATTVATVQDIEVVEPIHQRLQQQALLPDNHLLDSGYVSAEKLANSPIEYDIELVGPTRPDVSWQAQHPDAYDITRFHIDWQAEQVVCPQGKTSHYWKPQIGVRNNPVIEVNFRKKDCGPCPVRELCTRSKSSPRVLTIMHQEHFEALQAARVRQQTDAFRQQYAKRAGVEGTIGQAVNAYGMRQARYRGLDKTRFQHIATVVAINLQRIWAWLTGTPVAQTKVSAFATLAL
jgi:transposase